MKKCPFCNAEIEENARFCLYCMSSLEEKQVIETPKENTKRWPIILIAFLFVVLFIILAIFFLKEDKPDNKHPDSSQNNTDKVLKTDESSVDLSTEDQPKDEDNISKQPSSETTIQDQDPTGSTTQNNSTTNNNPNSNTTTGSSGTVTETKNNTPPTPTDPTSDLDMTTPTNPTPNPSVTAVTYLYRDAKYGDDFSVSANLENAVVIIGVKTPSSSCEYIIPETIDNKKVIAIMGLAFCDDTIKDTVKKVVVPASVKTIWNNAFANCYNLTDIYFGGKAIYVEGNAFAPKSNRTGTLTIHCSYDCSDRNYRYYRNSAVYYDALYEEWNG